MKAIYFLLFMICGAALYGQNAVSGGLHQQLVELWYGYWEPSTRLTYTNDENNFFNHIDGEIWNIETFSWEPMVQIDYDLNAGHYINFITQQNWDMGSQNYADGFKTQYTYNPDWTEDVLTKQIWDGTQWENYTQVRYTYQEYNGGPHIIKVVNATWNDGTNEWVLHDQLLYTNDSNGNLQQILTQLYDNENSTWTDYGRQTYTTDTNGNVSYVLYELYYDAAWNISTHLLISYDSYNRRTIELTETWDNNFGWEPVSRFTYEYDEILGIADEHTNSVSLAPNPADDVLYVSSGKPLTAVTVYSLDGRRCAVPKNGNKLDIASLASGMYVIVAATQDGVEKLKFIKNKLP